MRPLEDRKVGWCSAGGDNMGSIRWRWGRREEEADKKRGENKKVRDRETISRPGLRGRKALNRRKDCRLKD